jgi:error-prone DNA polymerase
MVARAAKGEIEPLSDEMAAKICDDLLSFANYGFPESHAWSFALIGYATAYLKAHQPTEFFLGILNAQPMGFYPVSTLVHDAKRHGVEVRPPCLVRGDWECTGETEDSEAGAEDRVALRARRRDKTVDRLREARARRHFVNCRRRRAGVHTE